MNGRRIFYDRLITHFERNHVKTDILLPVWADNVLYEAYSSTGERPSVARTEAIVFSPNASDMTWEGGDAAAVHASFDRRAGSISMVLSAQEQGVTEDPDLHLVYENARTLRKERMISRSSVYIFPPVARRVRNVSQVSCPEDVTVLFRGYCDHFSVRFSDIQIWEDDCTQIIADHSHSASIGVWKNIEDGHQRWTICSAMSDLDDKQVDSARIVATEVLAVEYYFVQSPEVFCGARFG